MCCKAGALGHPTEGTRGQDCPLLRTENCGAQWEGPEGPTQTPEVMRGAWTAQSSRARSWPLARQGLESQMASPGTRSPGRGHITSVWSGEANSWEHLAVWGSGQRNTGEGHALLDSSPPSGARRSPEKEDSALTSWQTPALASPTQPPAEGNRLPHRCPHTELQAPPRVHPTPAKGHVRDRRRHNEPPVPCLPLRPGLRK